MCRESGWSLRDSILRVNKKEVVELGGVDLAFAAVVTAVDVISRHIIVVVFDFAVAFGTLPLRSTIAVTCRCEAFLFRGREIALIAMANADVALVLLDVPASGCFGLCPVGQPKKCVCRQICRWCLRSFGSPHPLVGNEGTRLPRAADKGVVCDHCRNTLNLKSRGATGAVRKAQLAEMERVPSLRTAHQNDVADWEKQRNNGGRCKKLGQQVKTCGEQRQIFSASRSFGNLWTVDLWEFFFKKEVPKERLESYNINGSAVVGIVEDPDKGWTPGVYKLKEKFEKMAKMTIDGASTADDDTTIADVQDMYSKIAKHTMVNVLHDKDQDTDGHSLLLKTQNGNIIC